ncbi:hypothetical protein CP532_1723 [Ophiocordyceps camponoti-leonardi (nom. inval.)]|nr:hypothetical protein CP532_1723 [Ophiocordyceps camponoti-leonardi (nom. inval.)]
MRAAMEKPSPLGSHILPRHFLPPRRVIVVATLFVAGLFFTCLRLAAARCDEGHAGGRRPYCGFRSSSSSRHDNDALPSAAADKGEHQERRQRQQECAAFPDTSRVLLIMKTGASEAYARLPTQILTNLKCVSDYVFYSDLQQTVAGHLVHDSLDTVLASVRLSNKDFDIYHRQRACDTDQVACNKGYDVGQEGWNLDKYKNIHMAEKVYAQRPGYDWYFFVDADTYVAWPTLMPWLDQLNADKKHHLGSVAYVNNFPFGHGGSGYLVSQAAMRHMFRGRSGVANRWDEYITRQCCGDYAFSYALSNETGVGVEQSWPTINGEKPYTLPYGTRAWCQPIVTMHHVDPEEVAEIWSLEVASNFSHPMRIRDLYHAFIKRKLRPVRNDWDNLSETTSYLNASAYHYSESELKQAKKGELSALELMAHRSFEDCRRACQSVASCVQYHFRNGICSFGDTIRHGKPMKPEKAEHEAQWQHRSGWIVKRIEEWVEAHDDCGREVNYPVKDRGWLP